MNSKLSSRCEKRSLRKLQRREYYKMSKGRKGRRGNKLTIDIEPPQTLETLEGEHLEASVLQVASGTSQGELRPDFSMFDDDEKETTQHHQNIAQSTSKCTSYKDPVCYVNLSIEKSLKMRFISLNCQSWSTAKSSVNTVVSNDKVDVLCLSETWEKDNDPINFQSWSSLSKSRKNNEGNGSAAILSKASDDFYISRRQDLEKDNKEAICADIVLKDGCSILLIVAYIPRTDEKVFRIT